MAFGFFRRHRRVVRRHAVHVRHVHAHAVMGRRRKYATEEERKAARRAAAARYRRSEKGRAAAARRRPLKLRSARRAFRGSSYDITEAVKGGRRPRRRKGLRGEFI